MFVFCIVFRIRGDLCLGRREEKVPLVIRNEI